MMTRTQTRRILPIVVLLIAASIYYSLATSKIEREAPMLSEKIWQVEVIDAKPQQLSPVITLYGRIESPEQLRAAAPGPGVVEKVFVRNGAEVARGQQLVILDRRDFEASLLQSEADLRDIANQITELEVRHQANLSTLQTEQNLLELAQDEVERLVKLKEQNLSSDTALNSARSELGRQQLTFVARELDVNSYPARLQILQARRDRDQALLDQAKLAMSRIDIRAPFNAIVSDVSVAAGDRVALGQILISLFPVDNLEIRAHLPITHISSVKQAINNGQKLRAHVENRPDLEQFTLHRLAGVAEATGIDIYFNIESGSVQLRPGELLPLRLQLPVESNVFAVPYQAIYGNSRIYQVVDQRLQAINVLSVGQIKDNNGDIRVLIRSEELGSGSQIAITHLPNAVSGLKVSTDDD